MHCLIVRKSNIDACAFYFYLMHRQRSKSCKCFDIFGTSLSVGAMCGLLRTLLDSMICRLGVDGREGTRNPIKQLTDGSGFKWEHMNSTNIIINME